MPHRPLARHAATLAAVLLAACGGADRALAPDTLLRADAARAAKGAAALDVWPGQSIQAAVDRAEPGSTIRIHGGVYAESVTVKKPRLTIVGVGGPNGERVVIVNPGGANNGVSVNDAGDGFVLSDVTVRGFARNGVRLRLADDFRLTRITAEDNGAYGLYPIRSSNGVVEHCTVSGSADAGIYVGLSNRVQVVHNTVFANVAGVEVSNADDVLVSHNKLYDNSIGVLVTLVPGRSVLTSTGVRVTHNRITDNDHVNFAPPGELVAAVPPGVGILVLGPDDVTVEHNTVTGNDFFGIGVLDESILGVLGAATPEELAKIETPSNRVRVRYNTVRDNGAAAPPGLFPGVDLLWDGSGTGNCWSTNRFGTSAPAASDLPACS
jgi:parallel beta-helix repeat protein